MIANKTTNERFRIRNPLTAKEIVVEICIAEFSFENVQEFDCVVCFETFEHIYYRHFIGILKRLKESGIETIIMSMPYHNLPVFFADTRLVYWRISFNIRIPKFLCQYVRKLSTHHKWEINYLDFSLDKIRSDIAETGYRITKEKDNACGNHHFFVLES